jgi:excisionase family DNA binding protein
MKTNNTPMYLKGALIVVVMDSKYSSIKSAILLHVQSEMFPTDVFLTQTFHKEVNELENKRWLSREETALALGISLSSISRLIKAGIIKPTYVGRRVLIPSSDVLENLPTLMEGRPRVMLPKEAVNA